MTPKEQLKRHRDMIVKILDESIEQGLDLTDIAVNRGTRKVDAGGDTSFEYDGSISVSFTFRKPNNSIS